ncbi:thioredoxin-like protein 1 [Amphiura filiformis]|uniref:thioredoxin-like protein 1 n=1 Tax=Amphiura filiformis TaxID=82378 RepID=UPI003B22223D
MENFKVLKEDSEFDTELTNAGSKLVIVDFTASWCQPCQRIGPIFQRLAPNYPKALFLKVDVDELQETAVTYGVRAMPTFLFFKNKQQVDKLQGADPNALESKIKVLYGDSDDEESADGPGVPGYNNINHLIDKRGSECLNQSDEHELEHCLKKGGGYLESDCDEQLIITLSFNQNVRLHSLKIHAPDDGKAPKTVKVFANLPNSMDFDGAERSEPIQTLELTKDDVAETGIIGLKFVKYQNVHSLTLFVKDNQGDEETSQIDYLGLIGVPVNTTKMDDFKRVAGKKGESH